MNSSTPTAILRWLADHGIFLIAEGESLRVRSRSPLTPAIRNRLQANKPSLLTHLAHSKQDVAVTDTNGFAAHQEGSQPAPAEPRIDRCTARSTVDTRFFEAGNPSAKKEEKVDTRSKGDTSPKQSQASGPDTSADLEYFYARSICPRSGDSDRVSTVDLAVQRSGEGVGASVTQKVECRPTPQKAVFLQITDQPGITRAATSLREWCGLVAIDTETTGLNPARDWVRLLQIAVGEEVYLIDLFAFADPAAVLAPLFAVLAEKEIVRHNITAFDLPFLARLDLAPKRVFDTAIASRVVYAGEKADHDLAAVVHRELGRQLDKAEQRSDWSNTILTQSQLAYAAADVSVLVPLAAILREKAATRKLESVLELEMRCAVPVARMAARGVGFATEPWHSLADAAAERKRTLVAEMNAMAPNPNCLPGMAGWNWDSNTVEVPRAFASVGITLKDTKEETLAGIHHPLARLLLDYREASKKTSTYGRTWVDEHVTDGRVYASWNLCQAKTGRMSCSRPNLQQIPRNAAYRRCFVARPEHVLVKCDFSQIELRIAAKVTGDKRMLAAYKNGEDLHTLTAARFLGVATSAVTKEARQMAKPVNFGAIYGLGPRSLRLKAKAEYGKDMTERQAKGFLDVFFAEFAGVRVWHNKLKRQKATEVRTLGARRIAVESEQFYGAKANYVVQGTGGDGLKRALVMLWERRAECPTAEPVLAVHDEVVLEVPEGEAEQAKVWLERCMIEAMAPLIDPVPVEVESNVARTWGG